MRSKKRFYADLKHYGVVTKTALNWKEFKNFIESEFMKYEIERIYHYYTTKDKEWDVQVIDFREGEVF